jgi:hypothetical protein
MKCGVCRTTIHDGQETLSGLFIGVCHAWCLWNEFIASLACEYPADMYGKRADASPAQTST